jgi:intracellular sulfur oxidation DsrE/DsrF family protein
MKYVFLALVIFLSGLGFASANADVEQLLAQSQPPFGVVFEIVEADEAALEHLLREEFALQIQNQGEYAEIHSQVQSLVSEEVPVYVCETHASWYGVSAEDFPDYVNVAPTGPGQVSLYQDMDYELIIIE